MADKEGSQFIEELENLNKLLDDQSRKLARGREIVTGMIKLVKEARELGIPNLVPSLQGLAETLAGSQTESAPVQAAAAPPANPAEVKPAPGPVAAQRQSRSRTRAKTSAQTSKPPAKADSSKWTVPPMMGRFWENILNSDQSPKTQFEALAQVWGRLDEVNIPYGHGKITIAEDIKRKDKSYLYQNLKRTGEYLLRIGKGNVPQDVEVTDQLKKLAKDTKITKKHTKLNTLMSSWGWS